MDVLMATIRSWSRLAVAAMACGCMGYGAAVLAQMMPDHSRPGWIHSPIPFELQAVHFADRSSALDDTARRILLEQAVILMQWPRESAVIYGHVEKSEAADADQANMLALARGESVKAYLVGAGIAANRLTVASRGRDWYATGVSSKSGPEHYRKATTEIPVRAVSN